MKKLRITAVSYLNTVPFVYGLKHAGSKDKFVLSLDVPAHCARKMVDGEADVGLVPVGALLHLKVPYHMLNYCIAADGEVSSVLLVSNVPLHEIRTVHLDSDSRTSVLLARILADHHWKIHPEWIHIKSLADLCMPESMVVIGDKAFGYRAKYRYAWDLSSEWKDITGLPFVFAAWIAVKDTDKDLVGALSSALEYGIAHVNEAIQDRLELGPVDIDLKKYLTQCIHFRMEERYRRGMELFIDYAGRLCDV